MVFDILLSCLISSDVENLDEVHERDLETDLLILVVKRLMIENRDFHTRVILMSATLNAESFQNYFPVWKCPELESKVEIVRIPSVTAHTISEHYIDNINGVELVSFVFSLTASLLVRSIL